MKGQIKKVLPKSAWQNVKINENNEPLVEVIETNRLKIGLVEKRYEAKFLVRKSVAEKLYKVAENLPENINLVLIEGYRTLEMQKQSWDAKFAKLKNDNQNWPDSQIEFYVNMVIAKPSPLANHHCGGAIDVTLAYENGELVDMGTPYPSEAQNLKMQKKFAMLPNSLFIKRITKQQEINRKILRDAMETQNFVWYPGEWWHYCYEDRMWAVYTNQTECFYGPIEI